MDAKATDLLGSEQLRYAYVYAKSIIRNFSLQTYKKSVNNLKEE